MVFGKGESQIQKAYVTLLSEFSDVLIYETVPKMKGEKFRVYVQPDAMPFAVKAPRTIGLALKPRLWEELSKLLEDGIIEPVTEPTPWVSPIVLVPRKGSSHMRLCVDYTRLNRSIDGSYYFSPAPEVSVADIPLANAVWFTKLDCILGYHQIEIDNDSRDFTTFITEFGRFRYVCVPFGIANIAEIFNRQLEEHLETQLH